MGAVLYQDMGSPYAVRARIEATSEFDPSIAISTVLVCQKPSGAQVEWTTTVTTQDTTQLVVTHSLAAGELDEVGFYNVYARSTVPGGARRTEVDGFFVDPPNRRRA